MRVTIYRLLLRLYPKELRAEFGQEMLGVFRSAIHAEPGPKRLLREYSSVVANGLRSRELPAGASPLVIGALLAAALQWAFFRYAVRLTGSVIKSFGDDAFPNMSIEAAFYAVGTLVALIPIVVLAARQVQAQSNRARLRPLR